MHEMFVFLKGSIERICLRCKAVFQILVSFPVPVAVHAAARFLRIQKRCCDRSHTLCVLVFARVNCLYLTETTIVGVHVPLSPF